MKMSISKLIFKMRELERPYNSSKETIYNNPEVNLQFGFFFFLCMPVDSNYVPYYQFFFLQVIFPLYML
jgi:hypothetical protein